MVSTPEFQKRVLSLPFSFGYEIIPFSHYPQFNEFNKLVSCDIVSDVICKVTENTLRLSRTP